MSDLVIFVLICDVLVVKEEAVDVSTSINYSSGKFVSSRKLFYGSDKAVNKFILKWLWINLIAAIAEPWCFCVSLS